MNEVTELWATYMWPNMCVIGISKGEEKVERGQKKDLKKYGLKLFKFHVKHLSPVPKSIMNPSRTHTRWFRPQHSAIKPEKDKDEILKAAREKWFIHNQRKTQLQAYRNNGCQNVVKWHI